ncbi:MAG: hypothetical protein HIU84_02620 [Acidobacteria bacterium]|nr:hypothetical protein [Acidobacteriota bacterium]
MSQRLQEEAWCVTSHYVFQGLDGPLVTEELQKSVALKVDRGHWPCRYAVCSPDGMIVRATPPFDCVGVLGVQISAKVAP